MFFWTEKLEFYRTLIQLRSEFFSYLLLRLERLFGLRNFRRKKAHTIFYELQAKLQSKWNKLKVHTPKNYLYSCKLNCSTVKRHVFFYKILTPNFTELNKWKKYWNSSCISHNTFSVHGSWFKFKVCQYMFMSFQKFRKLY